MEVIFVVEEWPSWQSFLAQRTWLSEVGLVFRGLWAPLALLLLVGRAPAPFPPRRGPHLGAIRVRRTAPHLPTGCSGA